MAGENSQRAKLDRSSAIQLGAVALIGSASVVAEAMTGGLSGGAIIAAGCTLAAKIGGDCIPNIIAGLFAKKLDEKMADKNAEERLRQNEHLQRAINLAIAEGVAEAAANLPGNKEGRKYLSGMAKAIRKNPLSLEIGDPDSPVRDDKIVDLLTGDAAAIQNHRPLAAAQWKELLGQYHVTEAKPDRKSALDAAADFLHVHFSRLLITEMKKAEVSSDFAWPALVMRFLGEISQGVRDSKVKLDDLRERMQTVETGVAAILDWTEKQVMAAHADGGGGIGEAAQVNIALIVRNSEVCAGILPELRARSKRADKMLIALANALARTKGYAKEAAKNTRPIPGMAESMAFVRERIAHLTSGGRLFTGIPNNLPDPSPHFAAREEQLAALHADLQTATTVAIGQQVALWADGGVGKTMLAEHYGWIFLDDYPGGVFKISGEVAQLRTELASLHRELKVDAENRTPEDIARDVEEKLEATDSLLIIDNVPDGGRWKDAEYKRFLPSGRCRRIVTTREEHLDGTKMKHLDVFDAAAGRSILARHRGDANDPVNHGTVERIVEWFGGLGSALLVVGVYMSLEEGLPWADYWADLQKGGLKSARLTHDAVKDKIIYRERFDAAFDRTLGRLPACEQRCLDYAALLPEDMIVGHWLTKLLEGDQSITLPAKPGYGDGRARPVVLHLSKLGLLRPSKAGKELLAVHRVLRARLMERLNEDAAHKAALLDAIIELAESRGKVSRDAVAGPMDEKDVAKRVAERDRLRSELTPLVALAGELATRGRMRAGVSLANWVNTPIRELGRYGEGRASLDRFTQDEAALLEGAGPKETATTFSNLAVIQRNQGDVPAARTSMVRAIEIETKHFPPDHPTFAISYSILAMIQKDQGDLTVARANMERAIEIETKHFPPDHPKFAIRYSNLAMIQQAQGDLTAARASMERAIEIERKHFEPDHPTLAISYSNLAAIQQEQGDLPAARASMERAIEIVRKHFEPDHPTFATSYSNLAMIQKDQGDLPAARANTERAIEIAEKHLGAEHPNLATMRSNLALIQIDQQDLAGARANMERAIEIEKKHFAPDHPTVAIIYNNLGGVELESGNKSAACGHFQQALAIWLKHFDENHPSVMTVRRSMKIAGCTP